MIKFDEGIEFNEKKYYLKLKKNFLRETFFKKQLAISK